MYVCVCCDDGGDGDGDGGGGDGGGGGGGDGGSGSGCGGGGSGCGGGDGERSHTWTEPTRPPQPPEGHRCPARRVYEKRSPYMWSRVCVDTQF